jgi:hypothetical protein
MIVARGGNLNCTRISIRPPPMVIHLRMTPASNLANAISPLPNSANALRESSAVPAATIPAPKTAARASRQPRMRKKIPAKTPAAICQTTTRSARRRPEARLLSKYGPRAVCTKRRRHSHGSHTDLEKYISRPNGTTTKLQSDSDGYRKKNTRRRNILRCACPRLR